MKAWHDRPDQDRHRPLAVPRRGTVATLFGRARGEAEGWPLRVEMPKLGNTVEGCLLAAPGGRTRGDSGPKRAR